MLRRSLLLLTALLLAGGAARGDALMVTRAMKATTIAEVFVAEDAVRVALEIGVGDVRAFVGLLPDSFFEQVDGEVPPESERHARFFREGWAVKADGVLLEGRVVSVEPRRRVPRDEITGQPRDVPEDASEAVLFATLLFPLAGQPTTLTIRPPLSEETGRSAADIGVMLYHDDLPVCDFRYLGQEETVDLDWNDPFYSRFRNRNLWRQFNSPISAFLYVDAFEIRKEVVARPKDLQAFVDLGLAGKQVIPVEDQAAIKEKVAAFLKDHCPVLVDGRSIPPILDRIHFIERTLRTTGVIDPPRDLSVNAATLGIIFAYPVDELPQRATLEWELWNERVQEVPTSATDEAGGMPSRLTPEDPLLVWQNFLKNPTTGALDVVSRPERRGGWPLLTIFAAGLGALLLAAVATGRFRRKALGLIAAAGCLALAFVLLPHARIGGRAVADDEASAVVQGLLRNVYRAFDRRGEEAVYDALERSVDGELLERVYLETRRSLVLANQGGARAKVKQVDLDTLEVTSTDDGEGFNARSTWQVLGSVGHWGHIHQRQNRYEAILEIRPVADGWKITDLDILSEERQ